MSNEYKFTLSSDPRYREAQKLEKIPECLEDAIQIYSAILESTIERYGELGIETARAYFLYGNALLLKEEENPSDNLLSNVQEEEQAQPSSSNPPNEVNEEESAQNVAEDDEEDEDEAACAAAEEASPDDLELAWEVLDVARSIVEKFQETESSSSNDIFLSQIYTRLGDLNRFNGLFKEATDEYEKALAIRLQKCEKHDRLLSDIYFTLALTYVYFAGEKDVEDPTGKKQKALEFYKLSKKAIDLWLVRANELSTNGSPGEEAVTPEQVAEQTEISEILGENITALEDELAKLTQGAEVQEKPNPSSSSTTVIGFGAATDAPTAQSVNILAGSSMVKKKKRSADSMLDGSGPGSESHKKPSS